MSSIHWHLKSCLNIDVFFSFKNKSKNLAHWCIKEQWQYQNQYQGVKTQSGYLKFLQSPKFWLKAHGCFLHLQNQFWKKIWNMGVSKTTYLYFGSWEDSKLLGAKLIRVKIKLVSWASLSWVFWAKLIWVKSEFERWASLRQTNLSQKWIWELIISSELSFSEPNYSESKLNLRAQLLWAELLWAKLIWVKI